MQRAFSLFSASRATVTGGRATPARPCPRPLTSPGQKPIASATPTASARALPANVKQEGGKETLLQFPFPILPRPTPSSQGPKSVPETSPPPSIAKETREDPAAQPRQVSRPTWLTCGASCYLLARPSPAHPPSGSGYWRKLTRLEVEAVGNWEPPPPTPPHPETSRASLQVWAPRSLLSRRRRLRGWAGGSRACLAPRGYVAPRDLKAGSGASSRRTPSLLLGLLHPLNRISRGGGRRWGSLEEGEGSSFGARRRPLPLGPGEQQAPEREGRDCRSGSGLPGRERSP